MINHNQFMPKSNNVYTPISNIVYVQGDAGAKAYPLANGYTMLLMDSENQRFFIKSTDASGMPSMKTYKFEEEVIPEPEKIEYVTKADFEEFENKIISLLQPKKVEPKQKGGEANG